MFTVFECCDKITVLSQNVRIKLPSGIENRSLVFKPKLFEMWMFLMCLLMMSFDLSMTVIVTGFISGTVLSDFK